MDFNKSKNDELVKQWGLNFIKQTTDFEIGRASCRERV